MSELARAFAEAQSQIQMQAQMEVANRMVAICFDRCVSSPSGPITDKQRRCLDSCSAAFLDGFTVASETLSALAKKDASH